MLLSPKKRQKLLSPYLDLLQQARKNKQTSQSQLAEAAGLSAKYVTLIESGKRLPSLECFVALLSVAGVSRSAADRLVGDLLDQFSWADGD